MPISRFPVFLLLAMAAWTLGRGGPALALQDLARAPDQALLLDAQDGRLDQLELLEAVLLANGIHEAGLQHEMRSALQTYAEQLRPIVEETATAEELVAAIHNFLHTHVLTGEYQADCTQFSRAIRDGDFNCVSATVLFHLLARRFGLEPRAVATPTHVFSRVRCEAGDIDVQTTCAAWFQLTPAQRKQYEQTQLPATTDARAVREIGHLELLAKIYYNRGVRHLEAHRFAEAEQEFRSSLQLDPLDDAAQENLLAALNNWALERGDAGDFADASRILAEGLAINPQYAPLQANDLHIHQKWAQAYCREGRYAEAAELLIAGRTRQPSASLYGEGPLAIYRLWARELADQGDYAAAQRVCGEAEKQFGAEGARVDAARWMAELAEQLAAAGKAAAARELLAVGLAARPDAVALQEARERLTKAIP